MKIFIALFFCCQSFFVFSQYQIDLVTRQSPDRAVSQKIGFTHIEIKYGSPMVNGRTIWGELEPYEKVWRAGANYATTISFSTGVKINEKHIEKGTYTFFVIPRINKPWTIILNSVPKQWGAFRYDETKDAIRVEVIPQAIPKQEKLLYEIDNYGSQIALVRLKWDEIMLQLPIEIDLVQPLATMLKDKSETLTNDTKWVAYLQATELLLNEKTELNTALEWLEISEKLSNLEMDWNPQFYPKAYILGHLYWIKAKILRELEETKAAIIAAEKMKNLENPLFYDRNKEEENIDKQIEVWKN